MLVEGSPVCGKLIPLDGLLVMGIDGAEVDVVGLGVTGASGGS
jgi:hypothetical protein